MIFFYVSFWNWNRLFDLWYVLMVSHNVIGLAENGYVISKWTCNRCEYTQPQLWIVFAHIFMVSLISLLCKFLHRKFTHIKLLTMFATYNLQLLVVINMCTGFNAWSMKHMSCSCKLIIQKIWTVFSSVICGVQCSVFSAADI